MTNDNEISYEHELIDFPDAEELRSITTSKEEIFKGKKRSFLMSIGGDLVTKAKNQGLTQLSLTISNNFYGLDSSDQKRMVDEVTDFLKKQGLNVDVQEYQGQDPNNANNTVTNKTIKIDWSNANA